MFKPREISMKSSIKKCSVLNCSNTSRKSVDISFHKFPAPNCRFVYISDYFGNKRRVDQLTAWKSVLKVNKVISTTRVCSMHFSKEDYVLPDFPTSKRYLRVSAVPSQNLPNRDEKIQKKNKERLERRKKRENNAETTHALLQEPCIKKKTPTEDINLKFKKMNVHKSVNNDCNMEKSFVNQENECVCGVIEDCLVNSDALKNVDATSNTGVLCDKTYNDMPNNFDNVIEDAVSVEINNVDQVSENSAGDIPNNLEEEMIVEAVSNASKQPDQIKSGVDISSIKLSPKECSTQTDVVFYKFFNSLKSDQQLSTATGIESFALLKVIVESVKIATDCKYETNNCTVKTEERVVMTYVKLKQNCTYSFLALIFNSVTPQHCRNIFLETVRILSKCLKLAVPWPSKDEISVNIPQCFEDFEDTRVVLDCTEIFIQCPQKLCCQILTYSHYKGAQTAKIMTGVTPGGNISYISKPYGGRASDTAIFEQSDLVHLLEPKDAVMVDKGFLIKEVCQKNQFKFIQPPFLRNKKRFSKTEAEFTAKVAKARVHVERSNQRIKVFNILGSVMPVALVPYLEDIFVTICGTVNLSAPILGDDKFMVDEVDET